VAISAPTSLAVERAALHGLTLAAIDADELFCGIGGTHR
jgi:formate dehydrogenase assembly factor FdhD